MQTTTKETGKYPVKAQVQEILAVITAFSNLLIKETEALKKSDFKTVDTLQADKKLFAKQYQAKIEALAAHKAELPALELTLREKLIKERSRFGVVLNENMQALERAQNSVKRLVNNILDTARHAILEDQQTNYSRGGKAMTYKSASTSLSTDQRL
jgi:hypothetical protein